MRNPVALARITLNQHISVIVACAFGLSMLLALAPNARGQQITFSTPERDTTTQIGGESSETGVGAANWNSAMYVAYAGLTTVDPAGDTYVYIASNTDGGINYGNKTQVTVSGGQTVAGNSNPALAVFNGSLYLAYVDAYGAANFVSSQDGRNWGSEVYSCANGITVDASPSLAAFNGYLWMGLRDHNTHAMVICESLPTTQRPALNIARSH